MAKRRAATPPTEPSPSRREPLLGAHLSIAGGHHLAAAEAARLGFGALQIFTKSVKTWASRPLEPDAASRFREAVAAAGLRATVAHNSYLINLASPDPALWERSIAAMVDELRRAEALGLSDLVAHPGAHLGAGDEAGLDRVIRGLDEVHRRAPGLAVRIALETTAGQGTCLGHRFEHLGTLIRGVAEPDRLGVCVDTCHVFAAGYPMDSEGDYNAAMLALDHAVGLARVRVWHVNDSLKPLGSRRDRHAGIGQGLIGLATFRRILTDPRFAAVPKILETPKGVEDGVELDARNLALLRGLSDGSVMGGPHADEAADGDQTR
jgi:deoxyribonuclease-4